VRDGDPHASRPSGWNSSGAHHAGALCLGQSASVSIRRQHHQSRSRLDRRTAEPRAWRASARSMTPSRRSISAARAAGGVLAALAQEQQEAGLKKRARGQVASAASSAAGATPRGSTSQPMRAGGNAFENVP
jgi:hypothetical protein